MKKSVILWQINDNLNFLLLRVIDMNGSKMNQKMVLLIACFESIIVCTTAVKFSNRLCIDQFLPQNQQKIKIVLSKFRCIFLYFHIIPQKYNLLKKSTLTQIVLLSAGFTFPRQFKRNRVFFRYYSYGIRKISFTKKNPHSHKLFY